MLNYNRIAYELDTIKSGSDDVGGISTLLDFNYPEKWSFIGNATTSTDDPKFGLSCAHMPDTLSSIAITNVSGIYNLHPLGNYELEAFVKLEDVDWYEQGYRFYDGHTFRVFEFSGMSSWFSWTSAQSFCEERGGHLPTSTSKEKNDFLQRTAASYGHSIWLGGTEVNNPTIWEWVTGEEWSFTYWDEGHPLSTDDMPTPSNYLTLDYESGYWSDSANITFRTVVVCEWDYDFRNGTVFNVGDLTLTEHIKTVNEYYNDNGYKFYDGHTFLAILLTGNNRPDWVGAQEMCVARGGHLPTVTSAAKNEFLQSVIAGYDYNIWLGGTFSDTSNTWTWVTGEKWDYTNWTDGSPSTEMNNPYLMFDKDSREWSDEPSIQLGKLVVCEWDYDLRENPSEDVEVGVNLSLSCPTWGLSESTLLSDLTTNAWHHVLLRISDEVATVFIDGVEALKTSTTDSSTTLTPAMIQLGSFVGFIDEFVFRRNAGTTAPVVPTASYEADIVVMTNTLPISSVVFSCDNLPEGMTLSANGVFSGQPTVAGTYDCDVKVTTNWGITTKTIRIVVEED